ncbi:MAG: hypothetical protein IAA89_02195 [Firmicutes bacterium]|uniref:Uncharacterized protein n=1 Tax=Candidatus Gallilactobacillus intestinavium TaxID=2840838 RepID=A0A9D9H865_9LACO|nr:hypothetical protein [Candidatus Gallilactobacillus intestinavium]
MCIVELFMEKLLHFTMEEIIDFVKKKTKKIKEKPDLDVKLENNSKLTLKNYSDSAISDVAVLGFYDYKKDDTFDGKLDNPCLLTVEKMSYDSKVQIDLDQNEVVKVCTSNGILDKISSDFADKYGNSSLEEQQRVLNSIYDLNERRSKNYSKNELRDLVKKFWQGELNNYLKPTNFIILFRKNGQKFIKIYDVCPDSSLKLDGKSRNLGQLSYDFDYFNKHSLQKEDNVTQN